MKSKDNLPDILSWMFLVGLIVGITALVLYFYQFGGALSNKQEVWAQFGDFYSGFVGTIFAFLALLALLLTLKLQNQELKRSTEELKNSADALDKQVRSVDIQNFENRFFNLLSLHDEILTNLYGSFESFKKEYEGRAYLEKYLYYLESNLTEFRSQCEEENADEYLIQLVQTVEYMYINYENNIAQLFKIIHRILEFVDKSQVEDKASYVALLASIISNTEGKLLYYFGLVERNKNLKSLLIKYDFFDGFQQDIKLSEVEKKFYSIT